ncbi:recombinase family protein [Streptomyces sp. NPDC005485]|uniref:recombinase family protein n=1 Tax=Streptomyces sp. NPDC005485 TaxID=3155591 RepID=UPI0033A73205
MPNTPPGGLGHVPVAVYACATGTSAVCAAELRARHYADARHWHVAGAWTDDDPAAALDTRPGWSAVMSALSTGLIRGIVVAGASHVAAGAAHFAALGVLIRDRGGFFLTEAAPGPRHRSPGQHERRRALLDAAVGWSPRDHFAPGIAP